MNVRLNLHAIVAAGFGMVFFFGCSQNEFASSNRRTLLDSACACPASVDCQLTLKKIGEALVAEVSFTNRSGQTACVEKRHLLINNDMEWGAFEVMFEGVEVPYEGLTIKRGPMSRHDFHRLPPGSSFTSRIKIADFYDLSAPGRYTIKYRALNSCWPISSMLFEIESNEVAFAVR